MRYVLLSLLITTSAIAGRVEPTGAADTDRLSGNVLVWHDAMLYADASDDAQTVQVAKLDAPRKDRVGHVMPMHVLGTKGAFVEVEPLASRDCTWSQLVTHDDLANVRLYVRRADLAPVLVKPFTKTYADGSKLALRPGVAVVATDDGHYAISVRGDDLVTDIPSSAVAYAYAPDRNRVVSVTGTEYTLAANTKVKLGDQALVPTRWRAATIERGTEITRFTLDDRCTTVEVSVPTKAVHEVNDEEDSIGFGSSNHGVLELRNEHYLPAKTPLSSAQHQVAVAAKPIYLPAKAMSKHVCIERRFRLDTAIPANTDDVDDSLRLCAPATKVAHERMRSARSAYGSTSR